MKKQFIGYPSVPQDDAGYFYKVADVDARIAELEKALREAIEGIESWGGYATEYFREKHDLAGELARLRSVL